MTSIAQLTLTTRIGWGGIRAQRRFQPPLGPNYRNHELHGILTAGRASDL
jgi:hypothetical protein